MQDLLADLVETSGKNPKGGLQQIKRKICRDGGGGGLATPIFQRKNVFV